MSCIYRSMKSDEAAKLLMEQGGDGSFLIALSSNPPDLTLLCRRGNAIQKTRIQNAGDHYEMCGSEQFATLPQLIEFYSQGVGRMNVKASGEEIVLKNPFIINNIKKERWFHGRMSPAEAEKRLKREKPGSFLVRISHDSDCVLSYLDNNSQVIHVKIIEDDGKYTIGSGRFFPSLSELVDFFKKNDILILENLQLEDQSSKAPSSPADRRSMTKKFLLTNEVKAGRVMLSMFADRVAELSKVEESGIDGFQAEFQELLEVDEAESASSDADQLYVGNRDKNRYKNIVPYAKTRVKLINVDPKKPHSDYINANFIKISDLLPQVSRTYIATQGCLPNTIVDFWQMMWENQCTIIIMLTLIVEDGKNKCVPYWPNEGESLNFDLHGGCKLKLTAKKSSQNSLKTFTVRELSLQVMSPSPFSFLNSNKAKDKRSVYQYHYECWPDKDSPNDIPSVLQFLEEVDKQISKTSAKQPIVVHCSAGVGRSGTYILIDSVIQLIKNTGLSSDVDIPQLLLDIRKHRSGMVQTPNQYAVVYKAVLFYIKHCLGGNKSEI